MKAAYIIQLLAIISTIVCFLFSIFLTCQKIHWIDRIVPFLWQLIFGFLLLNSFNHGFPGELFKLLMVQIVWSVIALIISYRLLKIPTKPTRIVAWAQFVQAICLVLLFGFNYVATCWRCYGRIVWNP